MLTKPEAGPMVLWQATSAVRDEVVAAQKKFPPFNSAHEGFAVLLEEVDELKECVWLRQDKRDIEAMKNEAIQVAAMATRFIVDICNEKRGRT